MKSRLIVLLLLVVTLVLGLVWYLGRDGSPDEPEAEPAAAYLIERRSLVDSFRFTGVVGREVLGSVPIGGSGVVTEVAERGALIEEGDLIARVNGRPVVAVSGEGVLWRRLDLKGARQTGPDVEAIREFLLRQGVDPAAGSGYNGSLSRRVKEWRKLREEGPVDGVVEPTDLVFGSFPAVFEPAVVVGGVVGDGTILGDLLAPTLGVTSEVSPDQRQLLSVGTEAEVSGPGDYSASAVVSSVADSPSLAEDGAVTTYSVGLDVPELAGLVPGATVTVTVETDRRDGVLAVPMLALQGPADDPMVSVERDGVIRGVPVKTGLSTGTWIEIVSGLQEGDLLMIWGDSGR